MNAVRPEEMSVALLAGGLATRLKPITETIPKCLVEVAGRPFLEHQFALLRRAGIKKVVLCVGHMGEKVRAFAGDGQRFGLELTYAFDGEAPLHRRRPAPGFASTERPVFCALWGLLPAD